MFREEVFISFSLFCAFTSSVLWFHLIIRRHFFIGSTIIPVIARHFTNPDFIHVDLDLKKINATIS